MPRPTSGSDVYIYDTFDKIVPSFCKYKIHPNFVTIISMLSKYNLYQLLKKSKINKKTLFVLMISHALLDCLDGEVARGCMKYSKLGSRLDFVNDHIFMSIILCFILAKVLKVKFSLKNIIMLFFVIIMYNIVVNKFEIDNHNMQGKIEQLIHDNSVMVICILYFVLVYLITK